MFQARVLFMNGASIKFNTPNKADADKRAAAWKDVFFSAPLHGADECGNKISAIEVVPNLGKVAG
jgi:hypothetical protein